MILMRTMACVFGFAVPIWYTRSVQGDEVTYRFNVFIIVAVMLLGALAVPGGWLLRRLSKKYGFVLMFLGAVVLVFVGPMMWRDRVHVDDSHFDYQVGGFGGIHDSLRFDELRTIRWVETETQGRNRHMEYYLDCQKKSGPVARVPVGDLMHGAVPEILERAREHGVAVEGLPD